jgi:acetyl-CoA carboxylase biotin carboxyl carrier protein
MPAAAFLLNEQPSQPRPVVAEPQNPETIVDLKDIKAIIDLMRKNSISEFELEREDFKIKLKRGPNGSGALPGGYEDPSMVVLPAAAAPAVAQPVVTPPAPAPAPNEQDLKSPMIGTFYRAPSPESAAYVEVGAEVNPETVVCIIEAMKVMNEIKAECRGVITQVVAENAKPVEFGQPLFKVRPK